MPSPTLLPLLDYLKQTLQLGEKPVHTVDGGDGLVEHQGTLMELPGVHIAQAPEEGAPWLVVDRLTKTLPPDPPAEVAAWFDVPASPYERPSLRETPVAGQIEGTDLTEAALDAEALKVALTAYLQGPHATWAGAEKRRLRTIKLYRQLFTLAETLAQNSDRELVWGWGMALWKQEAYPTPMRYPLLTQALDLAVDPRTQQISLVPTDAPARAELNSFLSAKNPGAVRLKGIWEEDPALARAVTPWDDEGRDFFQQAVSLLDAEGQLLPKLPDSEPLPPPGRFLQVVDRWVIFDRKRSAAALILDLAQLAKHAETMTELPPPALALLTAPEDQQIQSTDVAFKGVYEEGLGRERPVAPTRELYFPLPFNTEQVRIAEQQEAGHSQVVEGPPGTGKSHTIVNLMAHAMATGKSVLVTSKGAPALAVLKDKLPAELRALCVFMLQGEKDGMREFEASIHYLSQQVSRLDAGRLQAEIVELDAQLDTLHSQIAAQDQAVLEVARAHLEPLTVSGQSVTAMALVERARDETQDHSWLTDGLDVATATPSLAIEAIRGLRSQLGEALSSVGQPFPSTVWTDGEATRIHRRLNQLSTLQTELQQLGLDWTAEVPVADPLWADWHHQATHLLALDLDWLNRFARASLNAGGDIRVEHARLSQAIVQWGQHQHAFAVRPVDVPDLGAASSQLLEVLNGRLQGGSKLTRWLQEPKVVRTTLLGVRVDGEPMMESDLGHVIKAIQHKQMGRKLKRKWHAIAAVLGLPEAEHIPSWLQAAEASFQAAKLINQAGLGLAKLPLAPSVRIQTVDEVKNLTERLARSVELRGQVARATADQDQVRQLKLRANNLGQGALAKAWAGVLDTLDQPSFDPVAWGVLHEAVAQQHLRVPRFEELRALVAEVQQAGAPAWADALLSLPVSADHDPWTPSNWADAWAWRQAYLAVQSLPTLQTLATLQEQRHSLDEQLNATRQRVVGQRTWLRVLERATPAVRVGLEAYLKAVKKIGKGTGKAAGRHRQDARAAMSAIYQAIPCWVMPHDRVVEFLPSRIGDFDLVILDEASQSDLRALPALLRGRQWLIVGDEKQVSPSNVGKIDEEEMQRLRRQYLKDAPFAAQLTPDNSVYDLCKVALAGQGTQVVLVEHFRCHPAIIEFSNREYYHGGLKALRIQRPSEKMDPPLVDVQVMGGVRKGKLNLPEAQFIVDEIKAITSDPAHAHRTIGVVSLLGTEQVAKIQDMLLNEVGEEIITRHQIECGDAARFQGKERSIMFLSMVATGDDHHPATRLDDRQRFNVAASRARDRMYLVRSVGLDDLTSFDDQKRKLVTHYQSPFVTSDAERQRAEQLFDSPFEKAIYTRLVQAGYQVRAQVPAGGFRLDLVVLGGQGRKLAVECDGDRFHGLDQWPADMARQRTLERVGWTFWRCFASNWYRQPEACFDDLVRMLEIQGIFPGAVADEADDLWVEHRQVSPVVIETTKARRKGKRPAASDPMDADSVEEDRVRAEAAAMDARPPALPTLPPLVFDDTPIIDPVHASLRVAPLVFEAPGGGAPPAPLAPAKAPLDLPADHPLVQFCQEHRLKLELAKSRGGSHWVYLDEPDGGQADFLIGIGFKYKPGKGFWKRGKLSPNTIA